MKDLFLQYAQGFDIFIVIVSAFIFIFSRKIIGFLDTTDIEKKHINEDDTKNIIKKVHFLHLINIFIIVTYFLTTFNSEVEILNNIIKVLFIVLFIYIINAWATKKILLYYGNEIEISWEKFFKKWYKASFFSLLTQTVFFIIGFFLTVETLWIDNYLQIWWIIAWFIAFFGFTAPVWAPDVIAWIIILHNDRVQIWNVIYIEELNMYAWVKKISLSEIKLIDLAHSHPILMRPSKFRWHKIENLSAWIVWKKTHLTRILIIKVGYENTQDSIIKLCQQAYTNMYENLDEWNKKMFLEKKEIHVEIWDFWDHAVHYKLFYEISSPFYILKASHIFNKYLKLEQEKSWIIFATPQLINVQKN